MITECNKKQIQVINPLTVVYNKSGKPRLVLDCRLINPHLHEFMFMFEDIKGSQGMFEKKGLIYLLMTYRELITTFISQGQNFYKLKYISLEEVKIVPFQQ